MKILFLLIAIAPAIIQGLDNGLAKKPPMGWMSWTRFACNTNCKDYPDECISERLYKEMADLMDKEGYREAGYLSVSVDDCWAESAREPGTSKMIGNKERFPSGMKALGDYIHSKNLKYGLYGDMGTSTCDGPYPGLVDPNGTLYFDIDAKTFAEWGVDYLKVDGCNLDVRLFDDYYPQFSRSILNTGRPIVLSCEWPLYQTGHVEQNYTAISQWCNVYRNFDDVADSWASVLRIIDFYTQNNAKFSQYNGPGMWNDPDMLTIGNFGLSFEQSKAQMAMWAMFSAPLIMSNDLRKISPQDKAILLNKQVIAINQDKAGHMAKPVADAGGVQVWVKQLSEKNHFAVAYLNKNTLGSGYVVSHSLNELLKDFTNDDVKFDVTDLFDQEILDPVINMSQSLNLKVVPSGVRIVKLTPQ